MIGKIVSMDFDGVIHSYKSGWCGADVIPDPPNPGAMEFILAALQHGLEIHIHSSRCATEEGCVAILHYMRKHAQEHFGFLPREFENIVISPDKPPAHVSIDDRAICFKGIWPTIKEIMEFQPWFKTATA